MLKGTLTVVVVFMAFLTPTLQQPRRRRETVSTLEVSEVMAVMASKSKALQCSPESLLGFSDPPYNISWTYNGDPMPWPYGSTTFEQPSYLGKDTLRSKYTNPDDEGNYTCTIISSNGTTVSKTFYICVTVSEETKEIPINPEISPSAKRLTGQSIVFTCEAYVGSPRCLNPYNYSVIWWKEDQTGKLVSVESLDNIKVTKTSKDEGVEGSLLEITRVQLAHYGVYHCIIKNQNGQLNLNVTLDEGIHELLMLEGLYRVGFVILLAVFIFLPIAVCVCRRSWIYIVLWMRDWTFNPSLEDGYLYDAFVIHGATSYEWVMEVLQPTLENTYRYKCFIPFRDLLGGEEFINGIAEVIGKCRRVMVVVTPCLLKDEMATWALQQAFQAVLDPNKQQRMFSLILQGIKKKQDYPDAPKRVFEILNHLTSKKVMVPYSCGLNKLEKYQEQSKTDVKTKKSEDETKKNDSKLKFQVEEGGTLRSRSKSPKNRKGVNRIRVVKGTLTNHLEDDCDKDGIPDGGGGGRRGKGGEGERGIGGTQPDFYFKEEEKDKKERLSIPNSTAPFIHRRRRSDQMEDKKPDTWLGRCVRVVFTGDEEQLFWQKLRLRLLPPLSQHRINVKNARLKMES